MSLPNLISLARLLSVPLTAWLILDGRLVAAFWLFFAAGVSDAVDGYIAKRFDARTRLGAFLDPLADKALLVAVYIALGLQGHLEDWLVILVVFRDILILGGVVLARLLDASLDTTPLLISKFNTAVQIVLAAATLGVNGYLVDDMGLLTILVYLTAAATALSGAGYVLRWVRQADTLGGLR